MRKSNWMPSIIPNSDDQTVYLVVDDFGRNGRAWRETDVENTDLETVILDLLEGQIQEPGSRRRLQYRRKMVAGRLGLCCPRITPTLRSPGA